MVEATLFGRDLSMERESIPGQVRKLPLAIAFFQVDTTGLPQHPYRYCTKSVLVMSLRIMALAWYFLVVDGGVLGFCLPGAGRGMSQRPSVRFLVPASTQLLSLNISIFFLSRMATQLSSHSCPMDNSDALVMPSKTCARFALSEKPGGNGSCPAWVD